jgi:hypothetical protein
MSSSYRSVLSLAALTVSIATPAQASAGGPPIGFGWGARITPMKELTEKQKQEVPVAPGREAAIGFKYRYFQIFLCDVWTWDGEPVLYDKDQYWRLTDHQWTQLLGQSEYDALGKPVFYRVPFGWGVVLLLVTVGNLIIWLRSINAGKTGSLLKDQRYQEAFRRYGEKLASSQNLSIGDNAQIVAFATAIEYLASEGIPPEQAKKNLVRILGWAGMPVSTPGA